MFASEVPIIAQADPTKAVLSGGKVLQVTPGGPGLQEAMDNIMAAGATGISAGNGATPRKGKGKKKA
jgi:hypothetical protein